MYYSTQHKRIRTVFATGLLVAAIALTPISFNVANAENNGNQENREERGNRYAYGHQIHVPPFIYFLAVWEERYGWLPPGLARLLERYEPYLEDDDEPVDEDPELTDSSVETGFTDATISLMFDEDVQARVFVSTESGFETDDDGVMRERERSYMDEHEFMFDELTEDTEYFYLVEFRDEDGNRVMSEEMSFMTDEMDEDPEITSLSATTSTSDADVTIEFSEDVQARLYVASYSGFVPRNADVAKITNRDFSDTQEYMVDGLTPDTEYFHRVLFRDRDGNQVWSNEMSFMTNAEAEEPEEDETAPAIESFTVEPGTTTADFYVELDEAAQVRLFVSPTAGFNRSTPGLIELTHTDFMTEHHFMVDGLEADTEYFYLISYRDDSNNSDRTSEDSFMTNAEAEPEDTTGPVISDISGEAGTTTIVGSWTTNEPATSAIYTATSTGFSLTDPGVIVTEDATLVTDHELTITGLSSSTTYYHRIVTEDEAGNETVSDEFTFGTS